MKKLFFLAWIGHLYLADLCASVRVGTRSNNRQHVNKQTLAQKRNPDVLNTAQTGTEFIVHPLQIPLMYVFGKGIVEAAYEVTKDFLVRSHETFADECNKTTYGFMDNCATATQASIRVPREIAQWSWEDISKTAKEATQPAFDAASEAYNKVTDGASALYNKAAKYATGAKDSLVNSITSGSKDAMSGAKKGFESFVTKTAAGARNAVNGLTKGMKNMVSDASKATNAATKPQHRDHMKPPPKEKEEKPVKGKPAGFDAAERKRAQIRARDD